MFTINSYIQNPNVPIYHFEEIKKNPLHYFININDAQNILRIKNNLDLHYIEGALYLAYNNQVILDFTTYDLIDHLWAYFLNMIEEFLEDQNSAEMDFPDTPIHMSIKKLSDDYILFILNIKMMSEWKLPKYEFFNALLIGAKDFFEKMILLIEEKNDIYQKQLQKIKKLEPKIKALKK